MQRSSLDPENRHKCCVFSCGRYTEPSRHHNTTAHTITDWQDDPRPLLKVDDEIHDFEVHREGAYAKGRTWVSLPNRKTAVRARQRRSASWWEQCIRAENDDDSEQHYHHEKENGNKEQLRLQTKSSPIGYKSTPPPLRRARASFGNPPPMAPEIGNASSSLRRGSMVHRRQASMPAAMSSPTEVRPHYTYFLAPPKSTDEQVTQNVHIPHPSVPALSVSAPEGSFVHQWARVANARENGSSEEPASTRRIPVRREAFIPAAVLGAGPDALAFDPRPPLKLEREVHDFECHKEGSHAAGHTVRGLRAEFRQIILRHSSIIGGKHGSRSASRSGSAQSSAASTPRSNANESRAHHVVEPSRTANLPQ